MTGKNDANPNKIYTLFHLPVLYSVNVNGISSPTMARNSAKLAILLGVGDDVRTSRCRFARIAKIICRYSHTEEGTIVFNNIRALRERWEPEVVARESGSRLFQAKVAKRACKARGAVASRQIPLQH